MNRKKMNALYRTEETTDPKTGKVRRTAHYIGPHYHVSQDALRKAKGWLTGLAVGGLILYGVTGLSVIAASRNAFVTAIYVLTALTLYHGICGCMEIWKLTDPIDEVEKEETIQETRNAMLVQLILNVLWLVGDGIVLMTDALPRDAVRESVCFLCMVLLTALTFRTWRVLSELKPEKIEEETGKASEGDKNDET